MLERCSLNVPAVTAEFLRKNTGCAHSKMSGK